MTTPRRAPGGGEALCSHVNWRVDSHHVEAVWDYDYLTIYVTCDDCGTSGNWTARILSLVDQYNQIRWDGGTLTITASTRGRA